MRLKEIKQLSQSHQAAERTIGRIKLKSPVPKLQFGITMSPLCTSHFWECFLYKAAWYLVRTLAQEGEDLGVKSLPSWVPSSLSTGPAHPLEATVTDSWKVGLGQIISHTSSLLRAPEHVTCSVTGIVILVLYCHVHYLPVCPHTPGVP